MSVLSDMQIMQRVHTQSMIHPFVAEQVGEGVFSYGLSSYGYDARIADEFKVFRDYPNARIDPKNAAGVFNQVQTPELWIEPGTFVLGRTIETFRIPRDVLVICVGKSSLARFGLIVNVTPLEPEWIGEVTIEISNTGSRPVKLYANEGICQFIFLRADDPCAKSYADKRGKYMHQTGVTEARL